MKKDAVLDKTRKYRYLLKRQWGDSSNFVNFILLNPSTANEIVDDPTVKACISFAKRWGYDGLYITNLFAYRTKSPKELKKADSPIGEENDKYLSKHAKKSDLVVAAWGNHGKFAGRNLEVLKIIKDTPIHCLGTTKLEEPRHPLYVRREQLAKKWTRR